MTEPYCPAPLLTLTSGPVEAYPEVLRALSTPMALPNGAWFRARFRATLQKLQRAMMTPHRPVILQGEVVLGLEAAAVSLIGRDDVVLNLASGPYGKGYTGLAARYAREVIEIEVAHDAAIDPAAVAEMFARRPDIGIVSVVHFETSCGTLNPVDEIGRIAHAHGALMIVDAASSWAGMSINPEQACADIFITGPHKCLGSAPGLTLLGISPKAWSHMAANPDAPRGSFLSILDWQNSGGENGRFPFIPSIAELNGLDAALDLYLAEGPENVWARHRRATEIFRAGVAAMGLGIWPATDSIASDTATAVRLPSGVIASDVLAAAQLLYGVSFSPGRGETAHNVVVVGLMARSAQPIYAITALAALGGALQALGCAVETGLGIAAATALVARQADA